MEPPAHTSGLSQAAAQSRAAKAGRDSPRKRARDSPNGAAPVAHSPDPPNQGNERVEERLGRDLKGRTEGGSRDRDRLSSAKGKVPLAGTNVAARAANSPGPRNQVNQGAEDRLQARGRAADGRRNGGLRDSAKAEAPNGVQDAAKAGHLRGELGLREEAALRVGRANPPPGAHPAAREERDAAHPAAALPAGDRAIEEEDVSCGPYGPETLRRDDRCRSR